jgi:hypothetical protein
MYHLTKSMHELCALASFTLLWVLLASGIGRSDMEVRSGAVKVVGFPVDSEACILESE